MTNSPYCIVKSYVILAMFCIIDLSIPLVEKKSDYVEKVWLVLETLGRIVVS